MSSNSTVAGTTTNKSQDGKILTKGGEVLYDTVKTEKDVEELYKHSQILSDAKEDAAKFDSSYVAILNAVKGSTHSKVLASQLIPTYFKYFPKLAGKAINALLDLCEEELREVRVHAIRGLPMLCKDTPAHVSNIANVVAQLLLTTSEEEEEKDEEKNGENRGGVSKKASPFLEVDAIKRAFSNLVIIDVNEALFQQMKATQEESARERAAIFLRDKVMTQAADLINKDKQVEALISDQVKNLAKNASEKEFQVLLEILQKISLYSGEDGPKKLVDLAIEHAGLSELSKSEFKATDTDLLNKVLACSSNVLPLFRKKGASNSSLFTFLITKVLPHFETFEDKVRLQILHSAALLSPYIGTSDARATIPILYPLMMHYFPEPPKDSSENPDINFSYVESFLYIFHQLALKAPGALNSICGIKIVTGQPQDSDMGDYQAKRDDFNSRVKFLEKKTEDYDKLLDSYSTTDKSKEYRKRLIANIITMCKPLLKKDPSFLKPRQVHLSWVAPKKPATKRESASADASTPDDQQSKKQRQFYTPPHRRDTSHSTGGSRGGRGRGYGGRGRRRGGHRGGRRW